MTTRGGMLGVVPIEGVLGLESSPLGYQSVSWVEGVLRQLVPYGPVTP